MTLSTKYDPAQVEDKWYAWWMEHHFFESKPDKDRMPYCIVIPPPNVTGVLHMGHMLNNTIQDILVRKARMEGKEALWVPGTDHASIATEARVVAMLREKGIKKSDLSREEFLKYAWEWRNKYGGIILEQLKKLGASCDWTRTTFTMDPEYYKAVMDVFVDLFDKGHIYRGLRMVNWDPQGKTALSDDEVIHREVQSKLYYLRYAVEGSDQYVTIATVRPETIMADTAVCINPKDKRYRHLKGKRAIIPLIDRAVPIIEDEYVTMDFGTGCLKVTPAHDMNDYELGLKHNLDVIDILNDDGTLNEKAILFVGEDRFVARKKIVKQLAENGLLEKEEDYLSNVGFSERTDAVIEPRLSLQWFLRMKELSKPAYAHVMNDDIQLIPSKFKNSYRHWMENVRDWCISRQLWWGQRIPAWYDEEGNITVGRDEAEARERYQKANKKQPSKFEQDPDVLDTWFSSWLWPMAVFDTTIFTKGKPKGNADLNYYYPTNDLVTAPEILFFWVARMIIAGYEYRGDLPFRNVYLTGVVRDKLGRKMSKSLGNSPDALELIKTYGADGVRAGMLFSSAAGNDLLFDEKLCEQGRNFANKLWNAFRLVHGWDVREGEASELNHLAMSWFEDRLKNVQKELNEHFEKFKISDALHTLYKLIWDDFCSWYLEMIKPPFEQPVDEITHGRTITFFEILLGWLHPFMPFITEELWHSLRERKDGEGLVVAPWPTMERYDSLAREMAYREQVHFEHIKEAIVFVRKVRQKAGYKNQEVIPVVITGSVDALDVVRVWQEIVQKVSGSVLEIANADMKETAGYEVYAAPGESWYVKLKDGNQDEQRANIQKDLDYLRGFLQSVNKKLSNEKFVSGAPASVVENERQKKADAEAKIKALEENLGLRGSKSEK